MVTPDGIISSFAGPYVGKRADMWMVRESKIEDRLRELMLDLLPAERLYLYGDKAYVSTFGVMGAYKRRAGQQLGRQYNEYNAAMPSCRIAVEHGFAQFDEPDYRLPLVEQRPRSLEVWKDRDFVTALLAFWSGGLMVVGIASGSGGSKTEKSINPSPGY
ncbi:MAG: hypothetical protein FRX48_03948 [Lasallia pustulata]|uniref:DDE Tnp4 domain-containing protein n=1 Tax=Lasallia pustulata TaxID=136370 RepID=A0A5M8PS69_9LECA|nr:MAG: hypothetical protein FRX48_03948 [Lasallia pustulata]